ncbi:MAG: HAD family hydrolase [Ruminiclostridium sp.]|nr:HAD family hydrolase [Ruminiclostridium sp.]
MNFEKIVIMTDLDGTLLDDKKQISEKDMAAIDEFRRGGGLFTLATGRGVAMARNIVDKLKIDIPCVIFNGAAVYDFTANKFLWHSSMPDCAADYIRTLAKEFPDIGIEILHAEKVYVTNYNQTVEEHMALESIVPVRCTLEEAPKEDWLKVLIAYPPERIDKIIEFTQNNCNIGVNWVHSSPMYYEMLPEGISKGTGLPRLLEVMGETERFTVASGDFGNDYDMVRMADLGVAVANAQQAVKDAAKLVVGDNNSSPMSQIIEYIRGL